jgi:hypothetical protein
MSFFSLNMTSEGDFGATYFPHVDRISVALGEAASMQLTAEEATALRDVLNHAIERATWEKCGTCQGTRLVTIDGNKALCGTCDAEGVVPR